MKTEVLTIRDCGHCLHITNGSEEIVVAYRVGKNGDVIETKEQLEQRGILAIAARNEL